MRGCSYGTRPLRRLSGGRACARPGTSKSPAWTAKAMLYAALLLAAGGEGRVNEGPAMAKLVAKSETLIADGPKGTSDPALTRARHLQVSALTAKTEPPSATNAFACLEAASDIVAVTGLHDTRYTTTNARNRAFDARSATFLIEKEIARDDLIRQRYRPVRHVLGWGLFLLEQTVGCLVGRPQGLGWSNPE